MTTQILSEVFYRNRFKKNLVRPEALALFHFHNDTLDSSRWGQNLSVSSEATFATPTGLGQTFFSSQACLYVQVPTISPVMTLSLSPALNMDCFTLEIFLVTPIPTSSETAKLDIRFESSLNEKYLLYSMTGDSVIGAPYRIRDYLASLSTLENTTNTTLFNTTTGAGHTVYSVKTLMLTGLQGTYSAYGQSMYDGRNWPYYRNELSKSMALTENESAGWYADKIHFNLMNIYVQELRILNNICRLTGAYQYATNYWIPPMTHYTGTEVYA